MARETRSLRFMAVMFRFLVSVIQTLLLAVVVLWFLGRFGTPGFSRSERTTVVVAGLALALLFAPVALLVWVFGKDGRATRG
ncbi:hypothetical protein [Streptomyces sp. SID13726]|uniref:hypothetical protein n=1 Tax=Streptomyces sp. SID13726 TaxID=2706058 RepID=UPI0013BA1B19|nr:hypothetical protein [Streptomyces sp. SID13726]NEB00925.1 hypothetical protein [Streptomyces sp. SID13726]